ncbi:ProQ/FINO family protein [Reinekea blandensis]|uniref:ProQ/FinO domain-containing protein n=1 Tax=Reinekea blandensis MED297 TaxID=314283 RepID=A4BE56_9GAMM|nr:ProQ/FinO family protein [Reinekea blandensis]EAR09534.1 hypothetical protein MED297_12422 [Reinekea blandensis MED297]
MSEQNTAAENNEVSQKKLEAKRKKEYEANRKALDELCELYPEVFNPTQPKPLQIGIHEAIAADGKLSKTRIRRALNLYVRMRKYIACLTTEGAERVTLGGVSTGTVTAEEAQHAQQKLAEIDKRRAAKRPATKPGKPKRKPHRAAKAPAKSQRKSAPQADTQKDSRSAEERMQAKLAALVNKKSND